MLGTEVCFSTNLHHTGETGYQPYLRILLPPELDGSSLTASFFGNELSTFNFGGIVSGGQVGDPLVNDNYLENLVLGPEGYSLYTLLLPVGSMVNEGVDLPVSFCAHQSGLAQLDQTFDVWVQPAYRYGDHPEGSNGPLIYDQSSVQVTPKAYTFAVSASSTNTPVGPCWPTQLILASDVADGVALQDVEMQMNIPDEYVFSGIAAVTPGCIVLNAPSVGSAGGTIQISCDNVFGGETSSDVQLMTNGYFADVVDHSSCGTTSSLMSGEMGINGSVTDQGEVPLILSHASVSPFVQAAELGLNQPASVGFDYKIQAYDDLVNPVFTVLLPDGISYSGTALLNGNMVVASSVTDMGGGQMELLFDLDEDDFTACSMGFFSFDVQIASTYSNGDMLHLGDGLPFSGMFNYDLLAGVSDCGAPFDTGIGIPSGSVLKEMISIPAFGEFYAPGEVVTYQLSAELPPGRSSGLVFEDIFPLPIHQVSDLSLVFGEDIYLSPLDDAGLTVQGISIDEGSNKLFIEWSGDESLNERTVAVMIDIPVSDVAFSGSLNHLNFGRFASVASDGSSSSSLSQIGLKVGSSDLSLVKGISETDNFDVVFSPIQFPINAGANGVDSFDWLTYVVTITNGGTTPAYDVIVNDFPPYPFLDNCYLETVTNEAGIPVASSGSLFESGLLLDVIESQASSPDDNRIFIQYKCQVQSGALSRNQHTNTAQVTWANAAGSADRFEPVSDLSQINIRRPEITTEVIKIQPGYEGNLFDIHVGELVTYHVAMTFPEGVVRDAIYECTLPQGLAFEDVLNAQADDGVFGYEEGNLPSIIDALEVSAIGEGEENERRRLLITFGDVINTASDNGEPEQVEFDLRAVVTNTAAAASGQVLNLQSKLIYKKGSNSALTDVLTEVPVNVKEASLTSSFALSSTSMEPGESTLATISVTHNSASNATAYDVEIIHDLPLGLEIDENSFLIECEELVQVIPNYELGLLTMKWDSIPQDLNCQLAFNVNLDEDFPPCTQMETCSELQWSSLLQADMDTLSYGPIGVLAQKRTGRITDVGWEENDYISISCQTIEVTNDDLANPIISGSTTVCAGENLILSTQDFNGNNIDYEWSGPGVPDGYNNQTLTLNNASELLNGTYSVLVREGECASVESMPVSVDVVLVPELSLLDVELSCSNGTDDLVLQALLTNNNGGLNYQWTGPQGFVSTDPEALILNANSSDEGTYTVFVSDQYGCTSQTVSTLVQISDAPPAPMILGTQNICEGESLELSCSAFPGDVSYTWQLPGGQQLTTSTPDIEISNTTFDDDGNYQVLAQVDACSTLWSTPLNVNVGAIPEQPQIEGLQGSFCEGDLLVFSTPANADEYAWEGPNGFTSNLASPPVIQNIDSLWNGSYSLWVTNNGCASETSTLEIEVLDQPESASIVGNGPLCSGESIVLSTGVIAQAYQWQLPNNESFTSAEPEWIIDQAGVAESGEYALLIYDGNCWSQPSETEWIQVDEIPNVQAIGGNSIVACIDEELQMNALNSDAYTGFWTSAHEELTIASPNDPTTSVLGVEQGSSYTMVWNLYNEGCGTYSSDEVLVQAPLPEQAEDDFYQVIEGNSIDFYVMQNDPYSDLLTFVELVNEPNHGTANANSGEFVEYRPDDEYSGPDELTYRRCLVACPSQCELAKVNIDVVPLLGIPDIITPNGDGVNDALRIEGLTRFPSNELIVYNRWGKEVHQSSPYDNSWEGTYQGEKLPSGTYFYVFLDKDRKQMLQQGYITIQ